MDETAVDQPYTPDLSILVVDEDEAQSEFYKMWLPEVEVQAVHSSAQLTEFDDSKAGVVVLDVDFSDRYTEELVRELRVESPCRQILVTGGHPMDEILGVTPDEFLVRPISSEVLRSTANELYERVLYGFLISSYYSLIVEANAREVTEESDMDQQPATHDQVLDQIGRVRESLAILTETLDKEARVEVKERLTESVDRQIPSHEASPDSAGCDCSITNESKAALRASDDWDRIASFVWMCTGCGRKQRKTRAGDSKVANQY